MYSVVLMMALSGSAAETPTFCRGRCNGCDSCWGCNGCYGCRGSRRHRCHGCRGCHGWGCYGGWGCHSSWGCYGCSGTVVVPANPPAAPKEEKKEPVAPPPEGSALPAPATIIVSLPADAKLTIDGAKTTSTSDLRTFVSPVLQPGKTFHYTLKASVVRDGKTIEVEEKVEVRAGAQTRVTLKPETSVASR
jgi:uncharacterized protein (TIGR03000 family)